MPESVKEYGANGALLGSVEYDDVTLRRFNAAGQLIEERPSTVAEKASITTATARVNDETLRSQALTAAANNRTFIAITSPTNAQNAAQVKALSRQMNGLIRMVLRQLDGTD